MTTWDDLTDHDELPSAALAGFGASASDERAPVTAPDAAPAYADVQDEDGLADPTGTVRIVVDDAYAVCGVRVATHWRDRGDQPLAQRVLFAAQQATWGRLFAGAEAPVTELGSPHHPGGLLDNPIDPREVEENLERVLELRARLAELDRRSDVRPTVVRHDEAVGTSVNQRVTVSLDADRRPRSVQLDERWLATARAERIGASLTEAFGDAYARWTEPVVEPGEYQELIDELEQAGRRAFRPALVVGGWIDPREDEA